MTPLYIQGSAEELVSSTEMWIPAVEDYDS